MKLGEMQKSGRLSDLCRFAICPAPRTISGCEFLAYSNYSFRWRSRSSAQDND